MNIQSSVRISIVVAAFAVFTSPALSLPLITSVVENGTGRNANAAIATSATSRLPQPEGAGTSGALADEAYAYVTRTHEWTAARTLTATGVLSTLSDATTTL